MERNLKARITSYLSSHKRKKAGYWVLFSLGAVVVFCTTYALILPAITMSNELICGMEAHTHDESCWSLVEVLPQPEIICTEWEGADVVFHTHDAFCYDGNGELICPLEERERHVHDERCFVERRELICGQEGIDGTGGVGGMDAPAEPSAPDAPAESVESVVQPHTNTRVVHNHTHTDACYTLERGELICPLEEAEGHIHTDACYVEEPTGEWALTCPLEGVDAPVTDPETGLSDPSVHVHGSECYEPIVQRVLGCGQEESAGHIHSDECYAWERVLACQEPEVKVEEIPPQEMEPAVPDTPPEEAPVHIHTDECYEITKIPVCGQEELELHTHGPACYETIEVEDGMGGFITQEVLTCRLPVVIEHQHTEACVLRREGEAQEIMERTCGKTVHIHTDECYVETGPDPDPYFCGLTEHTHTEECYFESGELRCTIPEHHHDETCLDPDNFPDPEYPIEIPEEPGGDGTDPERPGEPGDPENPGADLAPVEINESVEFTTDAFVMTFHVDGIALPVLEEGEEVSGGPEESGGSVWNGQEAWPPMTDTEVTDVHPALPPVDHETDAAASPDLPQTGGEPDGTVPPEDAGEDLTFPPESAGADPAAPPENQEPADYEPAETLPPPPEEDVEDAPLSSRASRDGGRLLSLQDWSVPLSAFPEDDSFPLSSGEEDGGGTDSAVMPDDSGLGADSGFADAAPDPTQDDVITAPDPVPDTSRTESSSQEIEFEMVEVTEGEEREELVAEILKTLDEQTLIAPPQVMEIVATRGGRKLDLTGCKITVEVRPTQQLTEAVSGDSLSTADLLDTEDGTALPEDGQEEQKAPGMALTVLPAGGEPVVKLYDAAAMETGGEREPVTVELTAYKGRMLYSTAPNFVVNPAFKVQFYIDIEEPLSEEQKLNSLPFIDTNGGVLPVNGKLDLPTKYLQLDTNGVVQYHRSLKELYKEEDREFNPKLEEKLNVDYLNSLRNNQNYELTALWILKPGADPKSTKPEDWTVKEGTLADLNTRIQFTNNPDAAEADPSGNTILISQSEDTVVRLVYQAGSKVGAFSSDATFYDYDISDGLAVGEGKTVMNVDKQGINSTGNCDKEKKLAFGNGFVATGYHNVAYNRADAANYGKCTFGLAADTLTDGNISFKVPAPDLFTDAAQAGKTRVDDIKLSFNRRGDTYTLSSAGTKAIGLEKFTSLGKKWNSEEQNWSNNFWPMDAASSWGTEGHDIKFGSAANEQINKYTGADGKTGTLLTCDDKQDHNPYFGMKFSVDFQLTPEYIGPLEYYFYGDDDMWVYLTDKDTGVSRLICDIGGVHAAVGEYVNMWDYVTGGKEDHSFGNYRLSVFYTERGASGSTCWMQFTVPEISEVKNDPYEPEKASLKIKKQVQSTTQEELEQEFEFQLQLAGLKNKYEMNFYGLDENGGKVLLRNDTVSDRMVNFTLKHDQWVEVVDLSPGVTYTVEELYKSDSCHTSVTGAEEVTKDTIASGTVTDGSTEVVYTNSFLYSLPETGGPTAVLYTTGGTALFAAAGSLLYSKKSRRRGAVEER